LPGLKPIKHWVRYPPSTATVIAIFRFHVHEGGLQRIGHALRGPVRNAELFADFIEADPTAPRCRQPCEPDQVLRFGKRHELTLMLKPVRD